MAKLFTALLVLMAATLVVCDPPYRLCKGVDDSIIAISKVTITPWPVQKGKPAKFQIEGTAKKDITQKGGRMDILVGTTKIFSTAVGSSSTTKAGPYNYQFQYALPSFVPPGDYFDDISMVGTDGSILTCIELDMHF